MSPREAGGAIVEYLVVLVAIMAGVMLLSANVRSESEQVMRTAIQQIPIIP